MAIGANQRMDAFTVVFDMDASGLATAAADGANRFELRYGAGFNVGLAVKFAQDAVTVYWNGIAMSIQSTALSARGTDHVTISMDAAGNFSVGLTYFF